MIKYTSFMSLTPNNFSSLRELTGRMAKGLFTPEKERSRIGEPAKPKDFSAAKNPLPAGTTLQFSAGWCKGSDKRMIAKKIETYETRDKPNAVYQVVPDGPRVKNPSNFTGFDFKTCWEACQRYFPDTIAVDGPAVAPPDDEPCTFPANYPVLNTTTQQFEAEYMDMMDEYRSNGYDEDCIKASVWWNQTAWPAYGILAKNDGCIADTDVKDYIETYYYSMLTFHSCVTNPNDPSTGYEQGETLFCMTPSGKVRTCNQQCYCQVCGGHHRVGAVKQATL